jgi:prepilin-type N-terminal cleavage/methylation domain-containing protein
MNELQLNDQKKLIKYQVGFTLAEILITLLIIGVVASLVVPAIIQDSQQQEYKTAYKKAYADISSALKSAFINSELCSSSGKWDISCHQNNFNAMKSKFVVVKECNDTAGREPCWAEGEDFYDIPQSRYSSCLFFMDNAGRSWASSASEPWVIVDTNGLKGPNINGLDRFAFIPVSDNTIEYQNFDITDSLIGIPVKIAVEKDYNYININMCPSGKCYNTSWLK